MVFPITQRKYGLSEIRDDFSQNNLLSVYNMCRSLIGGHLTARVNQSGEGGSYFHGVHAGRKTVTKASQK